MEDYLDTISQLPKAKRTFDLLYEFLDGWIKKSKLVRTGTLINEIPIGAHGLMDYLGFKMNKEEGIWESSSKTKDDTLEEAKELIDCLRLSLPDEEALGIILEP